MKTKIYLHILPAILLAAFITSGSFFINHVEKKKEKGEIENEKSSPELAYDNFLLSRTYPNAAFDVKGFAQLRFNKQQLSVYGVEFQPSFFQLNRLRFWIAIALP